MAYETPVKMNKSAPRPCDYATSYTRYTFIPYRRVIKTNITNSAPHIAFVPYLWDMRFFNRRPRVSHILDDKKGADIPCPISNMRTTISMKYVTFDTNTFSILNTNDDRVADEMKIVGDAIRQEIVKNNIKGFISEASVFVECLGFAEKLAYLAVVGTTEPRPTVDQRGIDAIQELNRLGLTMLHAPLVGAESFIESPWAEDKKCSAEVRQNRFGATCRKYGHPQKTVCKLKNIGNELLNAQPSVPPNRRMQTENGFQVEVRQKWAVGLKRDWDNGNQSHKKALRKQLNPIIGEWCDILIVSSHCAYGNDIFCTNDEGKGAGSGSLLHHLNRDTLLNDGIKIVSPKELLNHL